METEKDYDYVTIGETKYSGTVEIDAILSSNFTVTFFSDKRRTEKGFNLNWGCVKWNEWTPVGRGTCLEMTEPQPEYHGQDVKKHKKFRDIDEICGKLFLSTCLLFALHAFNEIGFCNKMNFIFHSERYFRVNRWKCK